MAIKAEAITPGRASASVPASVRAEANPVGSSPSSAEQVGRQAADALFRYVLSVNGKTGKVQLTASDVGALPDTTVIPTKTSQLENDSGFITEAPESPVQSVNGKTGNVVLDASDVGAMPSSYTAPVSSVNGKTGAVSLDASDVGALADDTLYAGSAAAGGAATRAAAFPYGEIESTSTSTVLTATVPGITSLYDGVHCYLRNDVVSSASGCTLNVNNLGAKPIYMTNADATRMTTQFSAATTYLFVYNSTRVDGGCWDMYLGQVGSNTIGYQLRTNNSTKPLSDACYRYRLLFSSPDGTKWVPANKDTQTSAAKTHTTNTTPIDPWGKIVYYGSTTIVNANVSPSKTVLWEQYELTLGYSFNNTGAALALTISKPVYLRCTPQADNSAVMDYFVQDLPTTADGKIYIYLGLATTATAIELDVLHPVYQYKAGMIRLWLGAPLPVADGGTGASNAADARDNLGLGDVAVEDIVPVTEGGTGADNASDARDNLGLTSLFIQSAYGAVGTEIESGDDLDDYTTPGTYVSLNGTITASLFNCPVTSGDFRLDVALTSGDDYLTQTIRGSAYATVYRRAYDNGTWTNWESTGDYINHEPDAVNVQSSKYTKLGEITLTPGIWMVAASARFASNATGYRRIYGIRNGATSSWLIDNQSSPAVSGTNTYIQFCTIVTTNGASMTYELYGYQTSGSTLATDGRMYAVKII